MRADNTAHVRKFHVNRMECTTNKRLYRKVGTKCRQCLKAAVEDIAAWVYNAKTEIERGIAYTCGI